MFNQAATRIRAGTRTDRSGNTRPDWSSDAVDRLDVTGLNIQPYSQTEIVDAERDSRITGYRVQSREGSAPDVRALDRIEWRGELYELDGEVAVWPALFTDAVDHIEFVMVRATG